MSIQSAKAFYLRMTTEQAFRAQLEQAANKEERQQIVQSAGFEFNREEWDTAVAQVRESNSADSELSDAQLEAVSGGAVGLIYGGPNIGLWPY